jgi:hypothetical protein
MLNSVRKTWNRSLPYRQYNLPGAILFIFFFISWIPLTALANGAADSSGITGSEIILLEKNHFSQFIVDESVVLDFKTKHVKVQYDIENTSSSAQSFRMVFPLESGPNCSDITARNSAKSWNEIVDFKVSLNKSKVAVKQQDRSSIVLQGEYKKFFDREDHTVCAFMTFNVRIKPGRNTLRIDYHLIPDWFAGDGIGEGWNYLYSIWPAKNWVSEFRKATWRVIKPQKPHGEYKHQFDDWYLQIIDSSNPDRYGHKWHKWELNIKGPGKREETDEYVEFTATDFKPSGELLVDYSITWLSSIVGSAKVKEKDSNDNNFLKAYLTLHPYIGDKMCYLFDDLRASHGGMAFAFNPKDLPYLKNEIYARKGYIFKSPDLNNYFSKLPWYHPENQEVVLNEIEEWNVQFITEVEKSAKSWNMKNDNGFGEDLEEIINKSKRTPCPKKGK